MLQNLSLFTNIHNKITEVARPILGPPARRIRRELQWRQRGINLGVTRPNTDRFPHTVAQHSSALFRPLLGLDEKLQKNKVVNLKIAAAALDGIVLDPGIRLSFWREVGKPSYRRGFIDGMILDHGRVAAGVGGGLCQMTNLLYWMTLHTPLSIAERWRHSYDVFPDCRRSQPFGSGATCAWPLFDLQIENNTSTSFRLSITVTGTHLVGSWTATDPIRQNYKIIEKAHRITHDGPGLYVRRNELWRQEYDADGTKRAEKIVASNNARLMYEPFLASGDN
jgi:vancomycin resistance protein VanW